MEQVENKLTGEIIEIPDTTDLDLHKQEVAKLFTDNILEMYYTIQGLEEQKKQFEFKLMEEMKKYGIKSIDNEYFNINYIAEHETTRVDTDKLKLAGIYEDFTKKSTTKESIRVKIK